MNQVNSALYTIGFADSGVGALIFALEVYAVLLPYLQKIQREYHVEFRFHHIGDSLHAPFGSKPVDRLKELTWDILAYLGAIEGCRQVVLACNTASTVVDSAMMARFNLEFPDVLLMPIIERSARALYDAGKIIEDETGAKVLRLGVLSTPATLVSGQFQQALEQIHAQEHGRFGVKLVVKSYGPDAWASLVEHGESAEVCSNVVLQDLSLWLVNPIEISALGLFCTHFPYLADLIRLHLQGLGLFGVELLTQSLLFVDQIKSTIEADLARGLYTKRHGDDLALRLADPMIFSHITGDNRSVVQSVISKCSPRFHNRVIFV